MHKENRLAYWRANLRLVAITVSLFTTPPPERIQHMVEHIRVPRHFDEDHA